MTAADFENEEDADDDLQEDDLSEDDSDAKLTADDVQDVVLYTLDWSVQSLLERIGGTFDINPAFQRRDAWNIDRKSKYIESLMLGLPVPQVVLAEVKNTRQFIVLDGKQRLITMKQFGAPDDQFRSFKLRKLEFLQDLNGMSFDKIQSSLTATQWADNFLNQPVRTIVVRNWGKNSVLYEVFVRLNQGSLPLSPQELRQALFPGSFATWINRKSADSKPIRRARRLTKEDFRMRDAEMLLRGVAFLYSIEQYDGNLRQFLDNMCEYGNSNWGAKESQFKKLAEAVESSIVRTESIFGVGNTYFRYSKGEPAAGYVRRFNIAVFDLMCLVLSSPELTDELIAEHACELKEQFELLCLNDPEFEDALKSTTKTPHATALRVIRYGRRVEEIVGVSLSIIGRAEALLSPGSNSELDT